MMHPTQQHDKAAYGKTDGRTVAAAIAALSPALSLYDAASLLLGCGVLTAPTRGWYSSAETYCVEKRACHPYAVIKCSMPNFNPHSIL